jgi:biopolymer transport protein ExbD
MATKVKTLDILLADGSTGYKDVPFTVVIDWIQQGRLLEDDQVRPSGTEKWYRIASSKALSVYLPRPEPYRVEDQAEALEPVAVDFSWKPPRGSDEDDPDMIPLIDISLVLLVFFMMTSTVIIAATSINVPGAAKAFIQNPVGVWWVGIDRRVLQDGREGPPAYSFGEGEKPADADHRDLTEAAVVEKLGAILKEQNALVNVRIAADRQLPAEIVMNMAAALEKLKPTYVREIHAEVSEQRK